VQRRDERRKPVVAHVGIGPEVEQRANELQGKLLPQRYRGIYASQDEFADAAQALRLARGL
jgi:hypothetical protein